jgi:hypothetical protein
MTAMFVVSVILWISAASFRALLTVMSMKALMTE